MYPVLEPGPAFPQPAKPILDSYDSAEECSFHHWIELCKLVDEGNDPEIEELAELTTSEV